MDFTFKATLWEYAGKGSWVFISLPKEYYPELKTLSLAGKKGFGSLRVAVTVGVTQWRTSIFPDTKSSSFVLPIKKSVRDQEHLKVGENAEVQIHLLDV